MKQALLAAALLGAVSLPAYAGNVVYDSYSTPDGQAFNTITTTADGAPDTPYSYYTGPVVLALHGGGSITVYCVDLNHYLAGSGTYSMGLLKMNGEGQAISEFDSSRIGQIAAIGIKALGDGNGDLAAAAQAAIWDISYSSDHPTSTTSDGILSGDIEYLLGIKFADRGYATAYIPFGDSVNQEMVGGTSAVPEPSTWAMGLAGFAFLGAMGWKRSRTARLALAK